MFMFNSFATTVPIKVIEIKSEKLNFDNNEAGSWMVTKSASWISKNKVRITFDVDSVEKINNSINDVIFVVDTSASMSESGFDSIKSAVKDVLDKLKGKASLISFNDTATILSDFTDDYDFVYNSVNSLSLTGNTNYYQALIKVDELLSSYVYDGKRPVSLVFLTDGYPSSDTPNEVSQYKYLKSKYEYLDIKAIQYNIGTAIVDNVKNISDKQFWANDKNINDVLYKAVFDIVYYDYFKIVDNVNEDYFSIDSVNFDMGEVSTDGNQVVWNIDNFISGGSSKLTINVTLKEKYQNSIDFLETNISEGVSSKIDGLEENVSSTLTPILSNNYTVTYDANAPIGCNVSNLPTAEQHIVYDTVTIPSEVPVCVGYQFKKWEIDNKKIEKVNADNFIMPEENVVLRAIWSKVELDKSMNGTISEQTTLYKVLQKEATSGGLAKEYTGEHQDSMASVGNRKIYYYDPSSSADRSEMLDKNNVIFADMCWQMVRTTDTGGVKMIYNGEPDSNGSCGTGRGTHVGYNGRTTSNLSGNYYYGTDYEYDSESKVFKLTGDLIQAKWTADNYGDLLDKYTCRATTSTGTCATLYYTESYYNASTAYVFSINGNSSYFQFGTMPFNANRGSPASVGYMFNKVYQFNAKNPATETVLKSATISTTYYFSDSVSYYNDKYLLNDPSTVSTTTDAVGKYTFRSTSDSTSNAVVYYIVKVVDTTMYYVEMTNGNDLEYYDKLYTYGTSYTDNGDGTYTINSPSIAKVTTWYDYYGNMRAKYLCKNATNNTCTQLFYVASTTKMNFTYLKSTDNFKYSSTFTYSDGVYKLNNAVSIWDFSDSDSVALLEKNQYTCFNDTGICDKINFIYFLSSYYKSMYYIILSDGKNSENALEEMFYADDLNTTNSTIKTAVDAWYKKYLYEYTSYLEDTIFCNDRTFGNTGGWRGDDILNYQLRFKYSSSLLCPNITDMFSLSNDKAKLKYSVGLLTIKERYFTADTEKRYWFLTPYSFNYDVATSYSGVDTRIVNSNLGVRPVISLKAGTSYINGDGSMNSPYIVDVEK